MRFQNNFQIKFTWHQQHEPSACRSPLGAFGSAWVENVSKDFLQGWLKNVSKVSTDFYGCYDVDDDDDDLGSGVHGGDDDAYFD